MAAVVNLPFDCLILVMKMLPFRDRVVCESVCRQWNTAAVECTATYQTAVCIFSEKDNVDKSCIQGFCDDAMHQISFAHDCVFASCDDVAGTTALDVRSVLAKCANLQSLHLKCYERETLILGGMEQLCTLCPRIQHLSISDDTRGCYVYKHGLAMIHGCTELAHLQLRFPAESTLDFLLENVILRKSLILHGQTLTMLSTNLPLSSDNCDLIANECSLTSLSLLGTSTTLDGLAMICTSPSCQLMLKHLSILIDWQLQLQLISESLINLTSFKCTIANQDIRELRCLASLKNLRSLFLSVWGSHNLDDEVSAILSGLCKLQSLTINGDVTDACLKQLASLCPLLQRLEVALNAQASGISDETIQLALCRLVQLKHLSLRNCDVTDAGVGTLFTSLPELSFVRLLVASKLTTAVCTIVQDYALRNGPRRIRAVLPIRLAPSFAEQDQPVIANLTIRFE